MMVDPSGAAESSHGALNTDERAALAAWAEHEPSGGFADAVLLAWSADLDVEPESPAATGQAEPQRTVSHRPLGRGVIGIGAALAAAAAVLLMLRVMPPGPGSAVASAHDCPPDGDAPGLTQPMSAVPAAQVEPQPQPRPDSLTMLADDAVAVLATHCSPCHDGSDADAKAGALEVFDIRERRWWMGMSSAQLAEARLRIDELGATSEDDRRSVAAFVDAQLSLHDHSG